MISEAFICEIAAARLTFSSRVAILRLAVANQPMTTYDVMAALRIGRRGVYRVFEYPIALGLVAKRAGSASHPTTYELTRRAQSRREEERVRA